jgi:hypothetical protein
MREPQMVERLYPELVLKTLMSDKNNAQGLGGYIL